jgi:hypothetical protein
MKRKELIDLVKKMIELSAYRNTFNDIKISNIKVHRIIKFIEIEYHKSLFCSKDKD